MLQRFAIHLTLALLFAFTQIGVATHEISHITNGSQHSQPHEKSQQKILLPNNARNVSAMQKSLVVY